jgi:hypothetical protein
VTTTATEIKAAYISQDKRLMAAAEEFFKNLWSSSMLYVADSFQKIAFNAYFGGYQQYKHMWE